MGFSGILGNCSGDLTTELGGQDDLNVGYDLWLQKRG